MLVHWHKHQACVTSRRTMRLPYTPGEAYVVQPPQYSVFVNSTDAFEDTWAPFFRLLGQFWPNCGEVVLNTERKSFECDGISVRSTRVARGGEQRIPWGECMLRALEHIPTELFIYLQDDYFLYDAVNVERVDEAAGIVAAEGLDCLRLMECGGAGPYEATEYPWLRAVSRRAAYRISLQAAVWTKTGMRKYLRAHESPWQLEVWGSRRAARIDGRIWAVSREFYGDGQRQIVPYVPTGIVKGAWNRAAVEDLFVAHDIQVDFTGRGWWDPASSRRSTLGQKIRKLPGYMWDRVRSL